MTARRLTALIYILLIVATLVHVAVNIYAALGHDVSAIRYMFLGSTNSQTYNGAVIHYQETGASYSYFSLPLTLVALALILWQRNKRAGDYADHMTWQLNSILGYGGILLLIVASMMFFFLTYLPIPLVILEAWFFYRIVRGLWCLGKEKPVYRHDSPIIMENR